MALPSAGLSSAAKALGLALREASGRQHQWTGHASRGPAVTRYAVDLAGL